MHTKHTNLTIRDSLSGGCVVKRGWIITSEKHLKLILSDGDVFLCSDIFEDGIPAGYINLTKHKSFNLKAHLINFPKFYRKIIARNILCHNSIEYINK
jgi:hypothetical protein